MKEFTIEEKARRYDEILKVASKYKDIHIMFSSIQDEMFPELAESEDERIRKAILELVRQSSEILEKKNQEQMIAWLEKHGESVEINPTEFDTRLQALIGKFSSLTKEELIGSLSFWMNVVQNGGTYKEEKPSEQKPAWSEEDEKMLDDIIEASTHHCYLNITDIDWLKSLKDRVQPQPKQEWSEEDEYLLDETIKHLESLIRITEKQGSAYSDEIQYYQRDIDWLKSLRPQKWRPTEDQIMCLQDAISNYQHRGYKAETLESLCKQLKQL